MAVCLQICVKNINKGKFVVKPVSLPNIQTYFVMVCIQVISVKLKIY